MNDKTKIKRPSWTWVTLPLVILIVGGWFLWQAFQPRSISTSEGMALISGTTVEKVVLNEGTQQVNLTLSQDYQHQSTGAGDPTTNMGKNVYFTYSYVQTSWTRSPSRPPRRDGTRCVPSPALWVLCSS